MKFLPPLERDIFNQLATCMIADRARLRSQAGRVVHSGQGIDDLRQRIARSQALYAQREQSRPAIRYPEELPVAARRQDILKAIGENQVVVIAGETGSGKTTQIPKMCLELGRGIAGIIGHTQPRRIAARSVAARIADELGVHPGSSVGFKVRFTEEASPTTLIKLMTDGILLAETQNDPLLLRYDTLILDEAHERSLNIDFLIGYIKRILPRRPDLKLIITSATIDPERFSRHFNNAPIIEVSGRTYPVDVLYRPLVSDDEDDADTDMVQGVVSALHELEQHKQGDVLVFLSGERDIRDLTDGLKREVTVGHKYDLIPLYARLSHEEQARIFAPHKKPRIVLSTNIAETSLTVPGIRYVIDTGLARISRYNPRSRVQRLPIEKISQASANQRKGRCGRVSEGICVRLYSEEDFLARDAFTEPEIQRTNLASVILQMTALRLGDVEDFPFIDPPDARQIRDGYATLHELGAVSQEKQLTPLGRKLARLTVDPRIGRMILAAHDENCVTDVLAIAAGLSIQDPRLRPSDQQEAADTAHLPFRDPTSDFLSLLRLWRWWEQAVKDYPQRQLRKVCHEHFLSFIRMREWEDVREQLEQQTVELQLRFNRLPQQSGPIHRAMLTGLLSHIGLRVDNHEYQGPQGRRFGIFPGSALFKHGPQWIMAAEIVETTRLYARTVAGISPGWVEREARHLLESVYSEPRWEPERARVEANEKLVMQGLVVVPQRRVHYGPIEPKHSHELFIQALTDGTYRSRAPFARHNQMMIDKVLAMEAKIRRADLLVDREQQAKFYAARIPDNINSGPQFEGWRRHAEQSNPHLLFMQLPDLLRPGATPVPEDQYPDQLTICGMTLPLRYRFAPGEPDDGITLMVPHDVLGRLEPEPLDWLVPGMLLEKISQLIRGLPSAYRRSFVPVPQFAQSIFNSLTPADYLQGITRVMSQKLGAMVGVEVPADAWREHALAPYLRLNLRVIDERNRTLATGRELLELQQKLIGTRPAVTTGLTAPQLPQELQINWDFGALPPEMTIRRHGASITAYPALVDQDNGVLIRLLESPGAADMATARGIIRLLTLRLGKQLRDTVEQMRLLDRMSLLYALIDHPQQLRRDLQYRIADLAAEGFSESARSRDTFEKLAAYAAPRIADAAALLEPLMHDILDAHQRVRITLDGLSDPQYTPTLYDVREQLEHLIYRGFLREVPWPWLRQYPRFLRGIESRLAKLQTLGGVEPDTRRAEPVSAYWRQYLLLKDRYQSMGRLNPDLAHFRWMLEEFRLAQFAQEIETIIPISERRLRDQLAKVHQ